MQSLFSQVDANFRELERQSKAADAADDADAVDAADDADADDAADDADDADDDIIPPSVATPIVTPAEMSVDEICAMIDSVHSRPSKFRAKRK
jgi:hypothetical protein